MNEFEKKIAETLGAMMFENRKLATLLEGANAEIEQLKAKIAATENRQIANGHAAEVEGAVT